MGRLPLIAYFEESAYFILFSLSAIPDAEVPAVAD